MLCLPMLLVLQQPLAGSHHKKYMCTRCALKVWASSSEMWIIKHKDSHSDVAADMCTPSDWVNTHQAAPLMSPASRKSECGLSMAGCVQVICSVCFARLYARRRLQHIHLHELEWPSVGAEHVDSTASSVRLWSCHGDCKPARQQWSCFFRHFVNHPLGLPRWLKFALHAVPSLSPSVCIVSLKIAIFSVKTHNCQRMSCVCIHNASSIVLFSIATVFIARMWLNKYPLKRKGKMLLYHEGTMTVSGQMFTKDPLHFLKLSWFSKAHSE